MNEGRKIKALKKVSGGDNEIVETGVFVGWGIDHRLMNSGMDDYYTLIYSVALIERADGTVFNHPINYIQFVNEDK